MVWVEAWDKLKGISFCKISNFTTDQTIMNENSLFFPFVL